MALGKHQDISRVKDVISKGKNMLKITKRTMVDLYLGVK